MRIQNLFILVPVMLIGLLLTGCAGNSTYREPSESEVAGFIPFGYRVIQPSEVFAPQIVYANFDNDSFPEVLLPMIAKGQEDPVKISIIDFNPNTNIWSLIATKQYDDFVNLNIIGKPTDLDRNNIAEVHIQFVPYSATGGVNSNSLAVLTMSNNELTDLMPNNTHYAYISNDQKEYKIASFVWGNNESHFGCHYWVIKTYAFVNTEYKLVDSYQTHNRYSMDVESYCDVFDLHRGVI